MKRFIPVLFLFILLSSCRKTESDFIWEKSYGSGKALFIRASSDSGFMACGEAGGKPYFVRLNKNRSTNIELKPDYPGLFSSSWYDTSGYIAGGSSNGRMLLMRYSPDGIKLWEKSIDGGFNINFTNMFYTGSGNLLAIGTSSPDSSEYGAPGLLFVRFDTTGLIINEEKFTATSFFSARKAIIDNDGNIYLAVTRWNTTAEPKITKASVAKFSNEFQLLWETDLYNNPNFGAASLAVELDGSGNVYVSGNTEVAAKDGLLNNSFLVSLSGSGSVLWKKYLENFNVGTSLLFNDSEELLMMNGNCFIINILSPDDGSDAGRVKMFGQCDSKNTDAWGADLAINYEKNFLVAGTRGESFYLALKSSK